MKNLVIVFIFIFGFSLQIKAQDIIITTKGETIAAKISTIDDDQVTYKKFKNLNGPDYILKKVRLKKSLLKMVLKKISLNLVIVNT